MFSSLEHSRLSKPYRRRLKVAIRHAYGWMTEVNYPIPDLNDPQSVVLMLVTYIQSCFDSGVNFWVPKHAVLAVRNYVPHLRPYLHRPWDALKSWKAQLALSNRVPLPFLVLQAMFGYMMDYALQFKGSANRWMSAALLFRVAFVALLRPGECSLLKAKDVKIVSEPQVDPVALIAIANPKNKHAMGRSQFVCIRDQSVVAWLVWLTHGLPQECKLFPGTHSDLVEIWDLTLAALGLTSVRFTLGSLRPGGSTWYYIHGKEIAYIKHLGRWASETSMACYIQEAMASLVWTKVDSSCESLLNQYISASEFAWIAPPSVPWPKLFSRERQWRLLRHPLRSRTSSQASTRLESSKLRVPISRKALTSFKVPSSR